MAEKIKKKVVRQVVPSKETKKGTQKRNKNLSELEMLERRKSKVLQSQNSESKATSQIQLHRAQEELLRSCLSEGMSREEIYELMNIKDNQYYEIEKRLLANDAQPHLAMSTAHRYYYIV